MKFIHIISIKHVNYAINLFIIVNIVQVSQFVLNARIIISYMIILNTSQTS